MGCDIHLYAEKKVYHYDDNERQNGKWVNIDRWTVNQDRIRYAGDKDRYSKMEIRYEDRFYAGRSYNLFSALSGVRSECFTNTPPRISDPKGFPKDASPEVKREKRKWKGDGHSHSWLTLAELKAFDWSAYGETCDKFRNETMPKLEKELSHYNTDEDVRVVFWFDN